MSSEEINQGQATFEGTSSTATTGSMASGSLTTGTITTGTIASGNISPSTMGTQTLDEPILTTIVKIYYIITLTIWFY